MQTEIDVTMAHMGVANLSEVYEKRDELIFRSA